MTDAASLTAELNALDDELSRVVRRVEDTLSALVSTRIEIVTDLGNLAFDNVGGRWMLTLDPDGTGPVPLAVLPRGRRAELVAGRRIHALVEGAAGLLTAAIGSRRTAIREAESLIDALASAGSRGEPG